MATADLLKASRSAHTAAKAALVAGDPVKAQAAFRVALEARLNARTADPDRMDAEWQNDALHPVMPGERGRRYLRMPGLTVAEVAARVDVDLERYFREQLGEVTGEMPAPVDPEVVTPKQWIVVKEGRRDEENKLLCRQRHVFQLLTFVQKTCQVCGQVEELRDTMPVERTMAFQQLQQDRADAESRTSAAGRRGKRA